MQQKSMHAILNEELEDHAVGHRQQQPVIVIGDEKANANESMVMVDAASSHTHDKILPNRKTLSESNRVPPSVPC